MASESGESTPLGAENAWAQEEEHGGVDEENQPTHIQHSDNTQEQDPDFNVSAALHTSGDSASNAGGDPSEDAGDYDPESVTVTPNPQLVEQIAAAPKPSPLPASKKHKTAGGFLVGDSDSEDEDDGATATPASNGLLAEPTQQQNHSLPRSRSPLHAATSASDPAPEADAAVVPEIPSSTSEVNSARGGNPFDLGPKIRSQAPPTQTINVVRPPQDPLSLLQDQINEEPRGAMDAWLALIAEYRRQNNTDELRSVYERFLAVFPSSVSVSFSSIREKCD